MDFTNDKIKIDFDTLGEKITFTDEDDTITGEVEKGWFKAIMKEEGVDADNFKLGLDLAHQVTGCLSATVAKKFQEEGKPVKIHTSLIGKLGSTVGIKNGSAKNPKSGEAVERPMISARYSLGKPDWITSFAKRLGEDLKASME
ncbi:MAG: hypothetical protein GY804_09370 [Alphaproteobacteria bacterium]|nr:hypothetical protein [Alphaproteobacteria bacterium]